MSSLRGSQTHDAVAAAAVNQRSSHQEIVQMSVEMRDDDEWIDPAVHCSDCDAVCCRLTVIVEPKDQVPRGLVVIDASGLEVMARGDGGWCVALDRPTMRCSIYEVRPGACRRFIMGAGYCRAVREDYDFDSARVIPHVLVDPLVLAVPDLGSADDDLW